MEEGCVWRCVNSAHNGDVRQDDEPEHRESAHLALSMGNASLNRLHAILKGPELTRSCRLGAVSPVVLVGIPHPSRGSSCGHLITLTGPLELPMRRSTLVLASERSERGQAGATVTSPRRIRFACLLYVDVSHCHEVSHRPMTCQPYTTDASRRARALQVLEP